MEVNLDSVLPNMFYNYTRKLYVRVYTLGTAWNFKPTLIRLRAVASQSR